MFFFPRFPLYVLYPGSGSDFTPLLSEMQLSTDLPVFMDKIRSAWSVSTLLLCDNSPEVASFFEKMNEGFIIYDRDKNIFKGEATYRKAWDESALQSLTVHNIERSTRTFGDQDKTPVPVTTLTLKASSGNQSAFTKAEFLYCEFQLLADFFREQSQKEKPELNISGLFLIGMPDGQYFIDAKILEKARFVVSELPPKYFKEHYLPVHIRLKNIGRPNRNYVTGRGAAVYLNHSEYSSTPLPGKSTFWIIPGLLCVQLNTTKTAEENRYSSDIYTISNDYEELTDSEVTQIVDRIDVSIASQKTTLLVEKNSAANMYLTIGAWLVRHGVVSGSAVYDYITTAARLGGINTNSMPAPDRNKQQAKLLRSRVLGQ